MKDILSSLESRFASSKSFRHFPISLKEQMKKLLKDTGIISITGIRKSGKLGLVKNYIDTVYAGENFLYIHPRISGQQNINESSQVFDILKEYEKGRKTPKVIILDECNSIKNIKSVINYFYKKGLYELILIGNHIRGEEISEIEVLPLEIERGREDLSFLGGLPIVRIAGDKEYKSMLLSAVYHEILMLDVAIPYAIKNIELFDQLMQYLSQLGDSVSKREVHRRISQSGKDISLLTLMEYLSIAQRIKLLKCLKVYDIKSQKYISTKSHFFFGDLGIAQFLGKKDPLQIKKNAFFLELQNYSSEIYSGIYGRFHCDFIVMNQGVIDVCFHFAGVQDKNEVRKTSRKLAKIEGKRKFVIVEDKQRLSLRKFEESGVSIIDFDEALSFLTYRD